MKAYNELITRILDAQNLEKFEWSVGAMLDDGPRSIVAVQGPSPSGKTTLLMIVRKILARVSEQDFELFPRVAFTHPGTIHLRGPRDPDVYTFMELNTDGYPEEDAIIIQMTGRTLPVNKHYVLMNQIDNEVPEIVDTCINRFRDLGTSRYITFEEND
jgi:energy-coupling factor transporter ATP-binding protein EcfA2